MGQEPQEEPHHVQGFSIFFWTKSSMVDSLSGLDAFVERFSGLHVFVMLLRTGHGFLALVPLWNDSLAGCLGFMFPVGGFLRARGV